MNFERDVQIDQDALDVEWRRQPMIYLKYSELYSGKQQQVNALKDNLEFIQAELDGEIRKGFEQEGKKYTEAKVKAQIILSKEYVDALKKFHEAEREASQLRFILTAMEHKKKALENLTSLWLSSYFSSPKSPKRRDQAEGLRDMAQNRQREALNKEKGE